MSQLPNFGIPAPERVAEELHCTIVAKCCETPEACWPANRCKRDIDGYMKHPRKRDVGAMRRKLLMVRECYSCGHPPSDGHHIIFRSHNGDDVEENIAPLCHMCHTVLHQDTGRDAAIVRTQIGESLLTSTHGEMEYVLRKLGVVAGQDYLRRHYMLGVPASLTKKLRKEWVPSNTSRLDIGDRTEWRPE